MNNPFTKVVLLSCFFISFIGCQQVPNEAKSLIEEIRTEYAPDKRVALWDVQMENGQLTGETNLPDALEELESRLTEQGVDYENEVILLPAAELEGKEFGVVTLSVANIRSEPSHSAELSTQAIMGTPLNVLKKRGGWYLVQTPDRYISWIDDGGLELMTKNEFEEWKQAEKVVFTGLIGYVYESAGSDQTVSDLAAGNIIEKVNETSTGFEVVLPDGREGFVKKENFSTLDEWIANQNPGPERMIITAKSMMGVPYLWGGTSTKGVDCSGYTKTIYFLNGKVIPRDASQQVHEGELVDTEQNWENLKVGDLLFFGRPATEDRGERVVHVGMWIGNNKFIHSSGRVRVSSFDPESPLYDEFNLNRYLKTKRLLNNPSENVLPVSKVI